MINRVKKSYKILMTKKLADSLSSMEQQRLDEYLLRNIAVRKYFTELKKLWDLTNNNSCPVIKLTQLDKEWENLLEKL